MAEIENVEEVWARMWSASARAAVPPKTENPALEILRQWGEANREAGRLEAVEAATGLRIEDVAQLAREPGAEPTWTRQTREETQRRGLPTSEPEQPSSLAEQTMAILNDGGHDNAFLTHAEAIDALTAELADVVSLGDARTEDLDGRVTDLLENQIKIEHAHRRRLANLETKTLHLPFPAALAPGA